MNCIHSAAGLCPDCRAEYDADPTAWIEFGEHAEGLRRWRALQDEIAAEREREPELPRREADDEIPF